MTLVRIGPNHEVVIPKRVCAKLGINAGDYVEVSVREHSALITPQQEDFPETDEPLGPKTQEGIREGLKDAEEGRVSGPFPNMAACLADLQQQQRRAKP